MGSSQTKIYNNIDEDIEAINHVTRNKQFEKRVGFFIDFSHARSIKKVTCKFVKV